MTCTAVEIQNEYGALVETSVSGEEQPLRFGKLESSQPAGQLSVRYLPRV